MRDPEKIALYEAILGDLLVYPQEVEFILGGLKEGYPALAQELVDKYHAS